MKLILTLLILAAGVTLQADPEYPRMGADIYDTRADGATQIAAALVQAKAQNKHVLIDLGANWCIWCRRLYELLEKDATVKQELKDNFILVLVDLNHRQGKKRNDTVNERYGDPMKEGLPVLVVLDASGKQLVTQESGALEDGKDAHDPAKVVTFLRRWALEK